MVRLLGFAVLLVLVCAGALRGAEDDQETLVMQQRALKARVADLRQERDYLLFRKRMNETDSKYLVINAKKKVLQLKYKNRLLKEIPIKNATGFTGKKITPGHFAMTRKIEGKKDRHALVFGENAFVIRWKLSEVVKPDSSLPVLVILKKDLLSFYYTAEPGMPAYVSP